MMGKKSQKRLGETQDLRGVERENANTTKYVYILDFKF